MRLYKAACQWGHYSHLNLAQCKKELNDEEARRIFQKKGHTGEEEKKVSKGRQTAAYNHC
jgi:hypothetical protein